MRVIQLSGIGVIVFLVLLLVAIAALLTLFLPLLIIFAILGIIIGALSWIRRLFSRKPRKHPAVIDVKYRIKE